MSKQAKMDKLIGKPSLHKSLGSFKAFTKNHLINNLENH